MLVLHSSQRVGIASERRSVSINETSAPPPFIHQLRPCGLRVSLLSVGSVGWRPARPSPAFKGRASLLKSKAARVARIRDQLPLYRRFDAEASTLGATRAWGAPFYHPSTVRYRGNSDDIQPRLVGWRAVREQAGRDTRLFLSG